MNEDRKKRLEELKNRNAQKANLLQTIKDSAPNTNLDSVLAPTVINTEDVINVTTKMADSNKAATEDMKEKTKILEEKMQTIKKPALKIEEDFKMEYLSDIKESKESFAQCDIWEKIDFKTLLQEKLDAKKKKPRAVSPFKNSESNRKARELT